MAWTWVAEDFNRSDRILDGDTVGASALTWEHWNSSASAANPPRIISNAPGTAGTEYGVQWLATDVAPLAGGAPILGVGIEVEFVSTKTTNGSNYFGELFAAIPASFTGDMAWVQAGGPGTSASVYRSGVSGSETSTGGPSVGIIAVAGGSPNRSASFTSTTQIGGTISAWSAGAVVRMEITYAGRLNVFYNGTAVFDLATPASLAGNTIVAGNLIRSYWNHDNWRVGVLT